MQKKKVLIAEDNFVLRKVLAKQAEQLGLPCDTACDGKEALKLLAEAKADYTLVISDLNMPDFSGFELVHTVRKLEETNHRPRLPIIAMTAYANITRLECLTAGFDDFFEKPVTSVVLQAIARKWVARGVCEPTT